MKKHHLLTAFANLAILAYLGLILLVFHATVTNTRVCDFAAFWSVSELLRNEGGERPYNREALVETVESISAEDEGLTYTHRYPPVSYFVFYPLSLLDHAPSYILWTVGGLIIIATVLRRVLTSHVGFRIVVASPAFFIDAIYGNNGNLNASIAAVSLLFLGTNPLIAGALSACLIYKPHLALLFPVLYLAGGHRKALLSFFVTSVSLVILSIFCFGASSWQAFFDLLLLTKKGTHVKFVNYVVVTTMPHMSAKAFGTSAPGIVLQVVMCFFVIAGLVYAARMVWKQGSASRTDESRKIACSDGSEHLLFALFSVAVLLFSPYGRIYDLTFSAISVAFYVRWLESTETACRRWDICLLVAMWVLPFAQLGVSSYSLATFGFPLPVAIPVMFSFMVLIIVRMRECSRRGC